MAQEFSESLYLSKLSQEIVHIVTQQQQQEIVAEEEIDEFGELTIMHPDDLEDNSDTESELEEEMFYDNRDDEEKCLVAALEAIAQKWKMFARDEPLPEPEPEPTGLINMDQLMDELMDELKDELWMLQKEAGFGRGCEELCT